MQRLFTLGDIYISDFLKEGEEPRGGRHDLQLMMEEDTKAVRLETTAPLDQMFGKYFYSSGINESMRNELNGIVQSIVPLISLKENDIWLDIASNDGTLLSYVPEGLIKIGIDPAEDSYKEQAEKHADLIVQDFFSAEAYKTTRFGNQKAKVITCIAMFYDLDKPDEFLQDIHEVLDDEGLLVMQLSHSGLMIDQCAFDNILSEHVYYYTLHSITPYLERNGFKVVDCQLNNTNGGSFRIYIRKEISNDSLFASQTYRDVCNYRIESLISYEILRGFHNPETWMEFYDKINALKEETVAFIKKAKSEGKKVWAYAASTKGNTLLQYFGLDHTMIDAIAERNTIKWGLKTVGTNIPIKSEDEMRKEKPDYVLILAWHFATSFIERESEYLNNGGKFIIPCPTFEII